MSIKQEELYDFYIAYVSSLNLSSSKTKLMQISRHYFEEFRNRFKTDVFFRTKNENKFQSIIRDKKLQTLLEAYDTEIDCTHDRTEVE